MAGGRTILWRRAKQISYLHIIPTAAVCSDYSEWNCS